MILSDLKNIHPNQRAFIVGKGPSLDTIEKISDQLSTGVIFALNESIHKIESLGLSCPQYCVQQDSELKSDCVPYHPQTVHLMNSWQDVMGDKRKRHVQKSDWSPDAVLYRPHDFKESECSLSAIMALKLAAFMGIDKVTFCCFDAMINNWNGPVTYANCVGKQREGSHRSHDAVIMIEAGKIMKSIKTLHPHVAFVETKL